MLDLVLDDAKALRAKVGRGDQQKLDQYLDSVRAVERRIDADERSLSAGDNADPAASKAVEALNARINKAFGGARTRRNSSARCRASITRSMSG